MKLYINGAAGRGRDKCQPPSLRPGKKYLALGSSWFVLGGERPASDFQLEQSSSFSFFLAFSLSSPFPALGELGESEKKKKSIALGRKEQRAGSGTTAHCPSTHTFIHRCTYNMHICVQITTWGQKDICTHTHTDAHVYTNISP